MNAPALALAASLDVRSSVRIGALRHDRHGWQVEADGIEAGRFEGAVVALPAEQARVLAAPFDEGFGEAARVASQPCWTVMAAFEDRVPVGADVLRHAGLLDWAARNVAKPGRSGPEAWVMHATPDWSRQNLERSPDGIGPDLLAGLAAAAGAPLPPTVAVAAHRWRYARSGSLGRPALWNGTLKLGLCGDWLLGPRVESAWLSGTALAAWIGTG